MGIGFPLQHIPANRSAYKETRIYGTEKARDRGGGGEAKEGDRNRDRILGLKHLLYEV